MVPPTVLQSLLVSPQGGLLQPLSPLASPCVPSWDLFLSPPAGPVGASPLLLLPWAAPAQLLQPPNPNTVRPAEQRLWPQAGLSPALPQGWPAPCRPPLASISFCWPVLCNPQPCLGVGLGGSTQTQAFQGLPDPPASELLPCRPCGH